MVVSCAHFPAGLTGEDSLRKQVRLAWDAKVRNDWGALYDVCATAFRNEFPRDNFVRRCNLQVEEFSIKEIEMVKPGEKALATINYKANQMGFVFDMTAEEEWILEEGIWRLNLSPSIMRLPFMDQK
jgi:hypothetical protein